MSNSAMGGGDWGKLIRRRVCWGGGGGGWSTSFACSTHHLYLEADLMMLVQLNIFSVLNTEFQIFQQFSFRDLIQISQISVQAVTIQQQYLIMKLRLVYLWQS